MASRSKVVGDLTYEAAEANNAETAFTISGRSVTFAEVEQSSTRVALNLQRLGVKRGDSCAVMMHNSVENILAWFGICKAGAVEVPVNTAYRGQLLQYILDQSDTQVVVCDGSLLLRIAEVAQDLKKVRHLVVNGSSDEIDAAKQELPSRIAVHSFDALLLDGTFHRPSLDHRDPSVILYTSGTTGPSKGVVLTHEMNLYTANHTVEICEYDHTDVLYTVFPLFHINAKYLSVLASLTASARLVMDASFSASTFWETCRENDVTAFNYQGALLLMLMKQPPSSGDLDNKVRRAIGAPAPPDIWEAFEDRFGLRLIEIYGMTEIAIATHRPPGESPIGSCGLPSKHLEVAVVDEEDQPVDPGVPGEIVVRPKRPFTIIQEYYKMPEKTVEAFRNLWFHTGDRARVDEGGFFYFIDRQKDAIRRRGENISSFEVEAVVNAHDAVLESAAYGVDSELSEEEVMIAVVQRSGESLTPEELVEYCDSRMASFAVPRYIRFVDSLPKTPSQRVEKYRLRQEGVTPDTWERGDKKASR